MAMDFSALSDTDLVYSYGHLLAELRRRSIIRSKNVVGDLGEYLAINMYNHTQGMPKLQAAPTGTKNVDALSRDGDRYSIKSTTTKATGVFWGLPSPDSNETPEQKFEYLVIVMLGETYELRRVNQLSWGDFLRFKSWDSRQRAWRVSITNELLSNTTTVFSVRPSFSCNRSR